MADVKERKSSALQNVSEWTNIFCLNIRDSARLKICRDVRFIWKDLGKSLIFWDRKINAVFFGQGNALLHGVHCNEVANSRRTKTCVANK